MNALGGLRLADRFRESVDDVLDANFVNRGQCLERGVTRIRDLAELKLADRGLIQAASGGNLVLRQPGGLSELPQIHDARLGFKSSCVKS